MLKTLLWLALLTVTNSIRCLSNIRGKMEISKLYSTLGSANVHFKQKNFEYVKSFRGIKPETFSHPLDVSMRNQLKSLPLLEYLGKSIFTTIEEAMIVENLGTSILVGPNQMPTLYRALQKASRILDIEPPDLYVKQSSQPNAFTVDSSSDKKPFIVLHTGLLDILNEKEVLAVLGHELGHLKCEHGIWIGLLSLLTETFDTLVPLSPLRSILLQWQRAAEYSCDRASLLVTQDCEVVAAVMMKICGGSTNNQYSKDLRVDAFLEQAKQFEKEKESVGGRMYILTNNQFSTHPLPLMRAVELVRWSKSMQYCGLVNRAINTRLH